MNASTYQSVTLHSNENVKHDNKDAESGCENASKLLLNDTQVSVTQYGHGSDHGSSVSRDEHEPFIDKKRENEPDHEELALTPKISVQETHTNSNAETLTHVEEDGDSNNLGDIPQVLPGCHGAPIHSEASEADQENGIISAIEQQVPLLIKTDIDSIVAFPCQTETLANSIDSSRSDVNIEISVTDSDKDKGDNCHGNSTLQAETPTQHRKPSAIKGSRKKSNKPREKRFVSFSDSCEDSDSATSVYGQGSSTKKDECENEGPDDGAAVLSRLDGPSRDTDGLVIDNDNVATLDKRSNSKRRKTQDTNGRRKESFEQRLRRRFTIKDKHKSEVTQRIIAIVVKYSLFVFNFISWVRTCMRGLLHVKTIILAY